MQVRVEALGEDVVRRQLLAMAGRVEDLEPAMGSVLDVLFESTEKQFDTEGAHGSGGWNRPSAEWTARKAALGLDERTEQATLDLRDSLTRRGGHNIAVATSDGLRFGSTVEYADEARKRGNILVQPTELERRGMVRIVQRYVIDGDRRASGLLAGVAS